MKDVKKENEKMENYSKDPTRRWPQSEDIMTPKKMWPHIEYDNNKKGDCPE